MFIITPINSTAHNFPECMHMPAGTHTHTHTPQHTCEPPRPSLFFICPSPPCYLIPPASSILCHYFSFGTRINLIPVYGAAIVSQIDVDRPASGRLDGKTDGKRRDRRREASRLAAK